MWAAAICGLVVFAILIASGAVFSLPGERMLEQLIPNWLVQVPLLLLWGLSCILIGIGILYAISHIIFKIVHEIGFRLAFDRHVIMSIINERKISLSDERDAQFSAATRERMSEIVQRDSGMYTVEVRVRKLRKEAAYRVRVTVRRLQLMSYGHTSKFVLKSP